MQTVRWTKNTVIKPFIKYSQNTKAGLTLNDEQIYEIKCVNELMCCAHVTAIYTAYQSVREHVLISHDLEVMSSNRGQTWAA